MVRLKALVVFFLALIMLLAATLLGASSLTPGSYLPVVVGKGNGPSPQPTPLSTATFSPTESPSYTPTPTSTVTDATPTPTNTSTSTPSPTASNTPTQTPTSTPTPCATLAGIIDTNTVLTSGCYYVVTANVLVEESITLTIPEDVTLKFDEAVYMQVDGTLLVNGTSILPVLFSKNSSAYWAGLRITSKSSSSSALYNLHLEYADGVSDRKSALHVDEAQPIMEGIKLSHNVAPLGLNAGTGKSLTFSNGEVTQNSESVDLIFGTNILENTVISGNNSPRAVAAIRTCEGNEIRNNSITNNESLGILLRGCAQEGTTIISDNTITGNRGAISNDVASTNFSAQIQSNHIENNSQVSIWPSEWTNTQAAIIVNCKVSFSQNNIANNNSIYEVRVVGNSECDISGMNNWWGTTQKDEIDALIFDYYDDFELGKIIYEPFAMEPYELP